MSKSAFERYAPFIQEYIFRKNWADLREVQVEACDAILDSDDHVNHSIRDSIRENRGSFLSKTDNLMAKSPRFHRGNLYRSPKGVDQ